MHHIIANAQNAEFIPIFANSTFMLGTQKIGIANDIFQISNASIRRERFCLTEKKNIIRYRTIFNFLQ